MAVAPQPFLAGQRITAGQLNDAVEKTLESVEVGIAGIVATTSGTTELDVSQLAMGPVSVTTANLYRNSIRLIGSQSVATDEFFCRIRRDTPVTGALVTEWVMYAPGTTNGFLFSSWSDFIPAVSNTAVNYYLSVARFAGSGVLNVWGQLNNQNRSGISVVRSGYGAQYRLVT